MILALEITLLVTSVLLIALVLLHKRQGWRAVGLVRRRRQHLAGGSSVAERNLDRVTVGWALSGRPRFWHSD